MAQFLDEDEATSYTSDNTHDALTQLREAANKKLTAANHVRTSRPNRLKS